VGLRFLGRIQRVGLSEARAFLFKWLECVVLFVLMIVVGIRVERESDTENKQKIIKKINKIEIN